MLKHILSEDRLKSGENRLLAQKPILPKHFNEVEIFIGQVDDYLSDQFGFRRNFISGANKVRYKLFKEISSKQITVGRNGFIFFNSHGANNPNSLIKSVCNIISLPKSFQDKTKLYFSTLQDHSKQVNITIDIAVIPSKSRVYPENLPELEKSWCSLASPAWWENMFQDSKQYRIYYPLKKMLELKTSIQVYLPNHFHWHGELPYLLAEDMMKTLWDIEPNFDLVPSKVRTESDLKTHFKGLHFYDDSVEYKIDKNIIRVCKGHNCVEDIEKYYQHNIAYVYKNISIKANSKLVVLADSFGQYIAKDFIRGFAEVIVIDTNNLAMDEQYKFYIWVTKTIKPTHLLYLMHDGGIYGRTLKLERLFKDIDKFGL